jgi:ABC-type Fe3+/spermidine/putrescine transport system ATPase subunit
MDNQLTLKDVCKVYPDGSPGLSHVSLSLGKGQKLSILGPSGSGKTTLLRCICGLETPDSGHIYFDGQPVDVVPPHKRQFGMMFQDFALFPHLSVYDNIAFGLKMQNKDRRAIQARVKEMMALTRLDGFEARHVDDLSGGERQRVALARTLAPKPRLLMLDEPLSSLDTGLRKKLLKELIGIIDALMLTAIFVTHDHEEAFLAGDYTMIMNKGEIVQQGTQEQLMQSPVNPWVSEFFTELM